MNISMWGQNEYDITFLIGAMLFFGQSVLMFRVLCTIKVKISLLLQYNYGKSAFPLIYNSVSTLFDTI